MVHELKILPEYFKEVISNKKKFEVRKNDRNFKVGDSLVLKEYINGEYTGAICICEVTYILQGGKYGINKDYCILSINKVTGLISIDMSDQEDKTCKIEKFKGE